MKKLTSISSWKYCPTTDNSSDHLTSGIPAHQLKTSSLWKHGPTWLPNQSQWPSWPRTEVLHLSATEMSIDRCTAHGSVPVQQQGLRHLINPADFSSLPRLLRVTAYVFRFVKLLQKKLSQQGPITAMEYDHAMTEWVKNRQSVVFHAEVANLSLTPYNLGMSILPFPWWRCLLHCGSRMHNALLSDNTKFPLRLPTKDHFTDLVIHSTSVKQLHAGDNSTLTTLCQSYWVPSVRQHIKTLIDKCIICRKEQPTMHQTHHPFPSQECNKHNLLKSQEWTKQELCMFKMLELKQRSTYGDCLFTYTTTRAIHLDCWSLLTRLSQICKLQISSKESNIWQCLNISISKQWTKGTVSISCAQGKAC